MNLLLPAEEGAALILAHDAERRRLAAARFMASLTTHIATDAWGANQWLQAWKGAPPVIVIIGDEHEAVEWYGAVAHSGPALWMRTDSGGAKHGFDLVVNVNCDDATLASSIALLLRVSERERQVQVLGRHVPKSLLWALSGGDSLEPKLKHMSILFADLRGFTDASGFSGPQELVSLLNDYIEAATREITKEGGILDKFTGDGICAYFGYDGRQDAPIGAVRSALALQTVLENLKVRWFDRGFLPVGAGVGVTTGSVTVGAVGSRERADYTIIGSTANLAARLQAHAHGGEVVIDVATADKVRHAFSLRGPRDVAIKGFTQAVPVYTVNLAPNSPGKMISINDL